MSLHKTVPSEKNYAKELNRLSLQQKDTEIETFFLTLETLFCTKKAARRLANRITEVYCKAVEQGLNNHALD